MLCCMKRKTGRSVAASPGKSGSVRTLRSPLTSPASETSLRKSHRTHMKVTDCMWAIGHCSQHSFCSCYTLTTSCYSSFCCLAEIPRCLLLVWRGVTVSSNNVKHSQPFDCNITSPVRTLGMLQVVSTTCHAQKCCVVAHLDQPYVCSLLLHPKLHTNYTYHMNRVCTVLHFQLWECSELVHTSRYVLAKQVHSRCHSAAFSTYGTSLD